MAITKKVRNHFNLTKAELAEFLNVSERTVSRWENGETSCSKGKGLLIEKLNKLRSSTVDNETIKKKLKLISTVTDLNPIRVICGLEVGGEKIEELVHKEINEILDKDLDLDF